MSSNVSTNETKQNKTKNQYDLVVTVAQGPNLQPQRTTKAGG